MTRTIRTFIERSLLPALERLGGHALPPGGLRVLGTRKPTWL